MTTPPHSVGALPAASRGDDFASRNNFLLLLLGLIATAERVLNVMPEIAANEAAAVKPSPEPPPDTLFR